MARFRRRRRRGYLRMRRIKPRAYIRRGRVKKAANRLSRLRKGADTIVTRIDTFAEDNFELGYTEIASTKFNSFELIGYCPYNSDAGWILGANPKRGWLGLSGRFRQLCSIYDAFKINYITFDVEVATSARFNPHNFVSTVSYNMGATDKQIILGVLVDRCRAYGATGLNTNSYAEFWTDPATVTTHCNLDKCPRIKLTVSPRTGEYSPWFDCPDSWSITGFPEYRNKSIVSGFLPFFYYSVRISGSETEFDNFGGRFIFEQTVGTPLKIPLRLKVSYGITFRGSLSGASIASAKVASIVQPTEHMEEFALKDEVTDVPVTNVQ